MRGSSPSEDLAREHMPLVEREVWRLARRLPPHVDRDDLVSAGLTALVACARVHRDSGPDFLRAAIVRVRGALVDELRRLDWASRSVRTRARELRAVEDELTSALRRTPNRAEVAVALGVTVRDVAARVEDSDRADTWRVDGLVVVDPAAGPEEQLLLRERIGYLRDAVAVLPDQLRTVVVRYFFEERTTAEIAAELGVGEHRVYEVRRMALAWLRDGVNAQLDPDLVATPRPAYFAAIAARGTLRSRLAVSPADRPARPVAADAAGPPPRRPSAA